MSASLTKVVLEAKNEIILSKEKNRVAHHETAHAVCSRLLEYVRPVRKVDLSGLSSLSVS